MDKPEGKQKKERGSQAKGPTLGPCLVPAKRSFHRSARRRGTGALQVSMGTVAVIGLERCVPFPGYTPSQQRVLLLNLTALLVNQSA